MPVLRPNIIPSLGIPTQVVAMPKQKRSRMNQADFYQQPERQSMPTVQQPSLQATDSQYQPPEQSFASDPITGDYIRAQLDSYKQRQAIPQLTPGSRVRSVDESIVEPANFQSFYDRLGITEDLGKTMLGAATAKKQHAENKRLMDVLSQQVQSPGSVALKGGPTGGGGQAFGSGVPSNPQANFKYAQEIGPKYGWTGNELSAWYTLGMKESGWRNTAQNPTSTAYGIGQFLNSTWAGVGIPKTSDPAMQVEAMARYIKNRYGSPSRALAFHLSHNWY